MKRFKTALKEIDEALSSKPGDGYLLYLKGFCLYQLNNAREAVELFKEAILYGFSPEECHYLIGRCFVELGNYFEAEDNFLTVLNINPRNAKVRTAYALMLQQNYSREKAYGLVLEALRLEPNDTSVLQIALGFYLNERDPKFRKEERALIESFLKNSSDEICKHVMAGHYEIKRRKFRDARENFRQAFVLNPEDKDVLRTLEALEFQCSIFNRPVIFIDKIGGFSNWAVISFFLVMIFVWLQDYTDSTLISIYKPLLVLWVILGSYKYLLTIIYLGAKRWKRFS